MAGGESEDADVKEHEAQRANSPEKARVLQCLPYRTQEGGGSGKLGVEGF